MYLFCEESAQVWIRGFAFVQFDNDGVLGVDFEGGLEQTITFLLTATSQGRPQEVPRRSHLCHSDHARVGVQTMCDLEQRENRNIKEV